MAVVLVSVPSAFAVEPPVILKVISGDNTLRVAWDGLHEKTKFWSVNVSYNCENGKARTTTIIHGHNFVDLKGLTNDIACTITLSGSNAGVMYYSIPVIATPTKDGSGGYVIPVVTPQKNSNNSYNPPPTIGVDKDGVRKVDNGLFLNGEYYQVGYFFTHMPMQYTSIGDENHASIKIYENSGAYAIDMIQFAPSVKEIGTSINISEPRLEIDIGNFANDIENSFLEGVILIDSENIIREYRVELSLDDCLNETPTPDCLRADIYWIYDKVPEFNVIGMNYWDLKRNTVTDYFNDGITVIDPNYVEPILEVPYKYECKDPELDTIMNGGDRNNCHFRAQLISMWN